MSQLQKPQPTHCPACSKPTDQMTEADFISHMDSHGWAQAKGSDIGWEKH